MLQVDWQGPKVEVIAAMGGLKGGRAETLVEKVSELGAWSLIPLLTERSPSIGKSPAFEGPKLPSQLQG